MAHEFKKVKKILVIKLKHIGDVLLTVPVFRALKENFRDAHITALVNSGTEEVLAGNPLVSEIIVFNRNIKNTGPLSKYREELLFLKKVREKGFDMVVDLNSGDRSAILSFITGARYRLAYLPYKKGFAGKKHLYTHLVKKRHNSHIVHMNLDVVRQFGIDTDNLAVDLFIGEKDREFAKRIFSENSIKEHDTVIHIHPLSRFSTKCWKDEYMAEVISWVINQNIRVIITSSPEKNELEKVKKILSIVNSTRYPWQRAAGEISQNIVNLCGKTTLKELAAVSRASSLFFGVDSAPMHIAAAVGTPVIALFGSAEKRWSPWGNNYTVISKITGERNEESKKEYTSRNLQHIKPEDVIIELKKRIHG